MNSFLKVHPQDDIIVALRNLPTGEQIEMEGEIIVLQEEIPAKHKFAGKDFSIGEDITMYGVRIGKAKVYIPKGNRISVENVVHSTDGFSEQRAKKSWSPPDVLVYSNKHFQGYYRADGKVGTRNYWIVFPLVFCENRNIKVIEETMNEALGYKTKSSNKLDISTLIDIYKRGGSKEEIHKADLLASNDRNKTNPLFPNVDGLKFLLHEGGCGGIRLDSETLCRLLAGYINNPNVAGATILSLGCQNAQFSYLESALEEFGTLNKKPVFILEQQKSKSERHFIEEAIKKTFTGLMEANNIQRKPAPLSKLVLGLECGGSDGFSGISANPALGHASDLIVALGGTTVLSEFPELNGVEQELIDRCETPELANKFSNLMKSYSQRAIDVGSGFDMNPSPGNIKDGLITDAMKSAGAAKKGGTSTITNVLDYTEQITKPGLTLLCTPGNDVESTTGLAGSGANIMVFTTGLGTPTGNPISPVIKFASNTILAEKMKDIIDIDAGSIISGEDSIQTKGEALLDLIIQVANGEVLTKAEILGQDDFIPWKRGVSL